MLPRPRVDMSKDPFTERKNIKEILSKQLKLSRSDLLQNKHE